MRLTVQLGSDRPKTATIFLAKIESSRLINTPGSLNINTLGASWSTLKPGIFWRAWKSSRKVLDLQALPSLPSACRLRLLDVSSSSSEEHDIGLELARFSAETDCLGCFLVEVEAGLLNKASSVLLVRFV